MVAPAAPLRNRRRERRDGEPVRGPVGLSFFGMRNTYGNPTVETTNLFVTVP
jgi:hypothetical protein